MKTARLELQSTHHTNHRVSEGGYLTSTIQTSKVGLVNYLENNFLRSCQCPREQRLLKFTVLGRSETMNLKGKPPNSVKSL